MNEKFGRLVLIHCLVLVLCVTFAVPVSAADGISRNPSISMQDLLLTLTPQTTATPVVSVDAEQLSDENFSELMAGLSVQIESIYAYTVDINDTLCVSGNGDAYQAKMSELAWLITQANSRLERLDLPYSFRLWEIYNTIQSDPVCGIGDEASLLADAARKTYHQAAQVVNYEDETILCPCYDIATDSWQNTGQYYAGSCKCL